MADANSKACTKCGAQKSLDEFYHQGHRYRSVCKICYGAHNKEMRAKHREKRDSYDRARGNGWDRTGREKWNPTHDEMMIQHYRRQYGMGPSDFAAMHKDQGGLCAICRGPCIRSTTGRLSVDHDHSTGKVRGLLCFKCNVGLGRFNDDVALLESAIEYLLKARTQNARGLEAVAA